MAPVKRVLAVVAAVLMIGGALLIRSRLDTREEAAECARVTAGQADRAWAVWLDELDR